MEGEAGAWLGPAGVDGEGFASWLTWTYVFLPLLAYVALRLQRAVQERRFAYAVANLADYVVQRAQTPTAGSRQGEVISYADIRRAAQTLVEIYRIDPGFFVEEQVVRHCQFVLLDRFFLKRFDEARLTQKELGNLHTVLGRFDTARSAHRRALFWFSTLVPYWMPVSVYERTAAAASRVDTLKRGKEDPDRLGGMTIAWSPEDGPSPGPPPRSRWRGLLTNALPVLTLALGAIEAEFGSTGALSAFGQSLWGLFG
jgi:hypothetical protein